MSLYHKYRPEKFENIIGNEETIEALQNMLQDISTCSHSFLLTGETGCGKTTIARIIATQLKCSKEDLREINTADFRGIDTIRELIKQSQFKPLSGNCRVWIIDECHKLTGDAQNAMLKILEDTPKHVYFVLCTTEPQKLLDTIKNRCSQFGVKPLNEKQMFTLLRTVVKAENESLTKLIYDQIIQDSLGHPRNALQILDQVFKVSPEKRLEIAKRSAEEQSESIELCRILLKSKVPWKLVCNILEKLKDQEPESIRRHVLGYCQAVLLKGQNDQAAAVIECFYESFYYIGFPGLVYACYKIIN
jgi:DNA polymerase-3 subunit gamma/tau